MDAMVIGGGAAGLGAAASLRRRGVEVVVLERGDGVGESWRRRYDGVRLNTVRWMSGLPGMRIPRAAGRWPARSEFADYLRSYAARQRIEVRTGVEAERIERSADGWHVETSAGPLEARYVVVAAGYDHSPRLPDWPGREQFAGELLHSADYRDPEPFRDRHVLVVGAGNSGIEIATELVRGEAASVQLSIRTPPNILTRELFGLPATPVAWLTERAPDRLADLGGALIQRLLWGDLERHGVAKAPYGIATELRRTQLGPVVDSGFVELLKAGRLEVVPAVEGFDGLDVLLRGGRRVLPDVVIAATGFRQQLEPLAAHLGVLLSDGRPAVNGGRAHPAAPGLYFNGYRLPLRGQLPYMRKTSTQIGRAVALDRARRRVRGFAGRERRSLPEEVTA